jgi:FkbM family methyltransferase
VCAESRNASVADLYSVVACHQSFAVSPGLFSMCAAARHASVLAIEPDERLCGLINRSAAAARDPITVLCAAVSDKNGMAELVISGRSRAANYLKEAKGSSQSSAARFTQPVELVTLDSLLDRFQPPSVLKIDAETYEVKCCSVRRGSSSLRVRTSGVKSHLKTHSQCSTSCTGATMNCSPQRLRSRGPRSPNAHHGTRWRFLANSDSPRRYIQSPPCRCRSSK